VRFTPYVAPTLQASCKHHAGGGGGARHVVAA